MGCARCCDNAAEQLLRVGRTALPAHAEVHATGICYCTCRQLQHALPEGL